MLHVANVVLIVLIDYVPNIPEWQISYSGMSTSWVPFPHMSGTEFLIYIRLSNIYCTSPHATYCAKG